MKKILLFGAGKSATVLIEYLLQQCSAVDWQLVVVDADAQLAANKVGVHSHGTALSFDVRNDGERRSHIQSASVVISLLPPALHLLVAQDCVACGKHLLTASYIDAGMETLRPGIEAKGLLFLCEMGLDPGIDHMSAKKLLDGIASKGGTLTHFHSHCGGLVAPESDDNPWHYKISWNPRNVVMAGKEGAVFLENGGPVSWPYEQLFAEERPVQVGNATYCWYPNRDSLRYLPLYNLPGCKSFLRTTLRHPDFMFGWKHLIELGLTDNTTRYDTDGMTLREFFRRHFEHVDFDGWLHKKLAFNLAAQERMLEHYEHVGPTNASEQLRQSTGAQLQQLLYRSGLLLDQLSWLGTGDGQTKIDGGVCSAADVLQFVLQQKLALQPGDRDLVVMQHEIVYELNGKKRRLTSSLTLEGKDHVHTAIAATVGLPLGIAAVLLLQGKLKATGLHIPVSPQFYKPILPLLQKQGILFRDNEVEQG